MQIFEGEKIWRILTNLWTFALAAFLIMNFFSLGAYDYLTPAFSIIYTGILSIYVGTKEFSRWCAIHENDRHPGELFIVGWTVLVLGLFAARFFLGGAYKVAPEVIADYIMVLSIFAVTQKSKRLCRKKKGK